MLKLEHNFNSEFENVASECSAVFEFLRLNNIEEKISREVELCLAEALNNIIIHSYKKQADKPISLSVELSDGKINIEIEDKGISRKNLDKPTLEFDPDDIDSLPEGGMGLFIIDQIMDETNYVTDGTTNKFSMKKNINNF